MNSSDNIPLILQTSITALMSVGQEWTLPLITEAYVTESKYLLTSMS